MNVRRPPAVLLGAMTVVGWLGGMAGCVDEPIVTGRRPAPTTTATALPTAVTDPPRPDRPDCAHCSGVLLDNIDDRGVPLCVTNGEGDKLTSSELLAAIFDCACTRNCVAQCSDNACVSVGTKSECLACASQFCSKELNSCLADLAP